MTPTVVSRRRPARWIPALAGLALVGQVLFCAPPAPAGAATPPLTQKAPTQGVVLVGSALADQLVVSGASGAVTYAQTAGTPSVTVSSSGAVTAPSTLAVGTYVASGTDTDTGGDSGTWSYTLTVLAQAPAGFSGTMVTVYSSMYGVAAQLGDASTLQPVSQYQQTVSSFNQLQLAAVYAATQQNPEWYQIPALMQSVSAGVPSSSPGMAVARSLAAGSTRRGATRVGVTHTTVRRTAGTPVGGTPVEPFQPQSCPPGIPDSAIFALQIVVDVAQGVYNFLAALAIAFADAIDTQVGIGEAAAVSAVVLVAVVIVHDVLAFEQQLYNDCQSNNLAGYVANIDNTTVQTYALLSTTAQAITDLQTTDQATQTDVLEVQNQLTTLQNTFVQTIANDTQSIQNTVGSDTQGVVTELQQDVVGLTQDVTSVQADETTLQQTITNQNNTNTTTISSGIASAVTQILTETDTDARNLTNTVNTNTQQILNAIQSNFSTQQSQWNQQLWLQIERDLATWGPSEPQVLMELPASQGGFLNSTPVGVQIVVTTDLNNVIADGVNVNPSATKDLAAANTALAAKKWITAYNDYAACYEMFA